MCTIEVWGLVRLLAASRSAIVLWDMPWKLQFQSFSIDIKLPWAYFGWRAPIECQPCLGLEGRFIAEPDPSHEALILYRQHGLLLEIWGIITHHGSFWTWSQFSKLVIGCPSINVVQLSSGVKCLMDGQRFDWLSTILILLSFRFNGDIRRILLSSCRDES